MKTIGIPHKSFLTLLPYAKIANYNACFLWEGCFPENMGSVKCILLLLQYSVSSHHFFGKEWILRNNNVLLQHFPSSGMMVCFRLRWSQILWYSTYQAVWGLWPLNLGKLSLTSRIQEKWHWASWGGGAHTFKNWQLSFFLEIHALET